MLITEKEQLLEYSKEKRLWQGIPGIEVTDKGRIFLTFYTGKIGEQIGNYVLLFKSDDGGVDFGEPIVAVLPKKTSRCYDACLWIDPLGRLWFTWATAPDYAVHAVICDDPDADELVWGAERIIGYSVMMNKPTVLSTGEWLFPMAVWARTLRMAEYDADQEHVPGQYVYRTNDNGETFVPIGRANVPKGTIDEHMVLERKDGTLAMYVRTPYGIGISYSYDQGKTWTQGIDSGIKGPGSRFCIRRLKSGRIILVNHYKFEGRSHLTAMLSEDEGKTWKYKLLLDERKDVSYPDLKEAADGYIYIAYDRERGSGRRNMQEAMTDAREILYAKITEQDIIEGKLTDAGSKLKTVAIKLVEYNGADKNPYSEDIYLSDRDLAQKLIDTIDGEDIVSEIFNIYPMSCIKIDNIDHDNIDAAIDKFAASNYRDVKILERVIKLARIANEEKDSCPSVVLVKEYIDEHYAEEFKAKELAGRLSCSIYHICHEFKKYTGLTITEYRNHKRLAHAKDMLIHTDENIGTISAVCGYSDESYFCKVFHREEGVMPGDYRKMLKR